MNDYEKATKAVKVVHGILDVAHQATKAIIESRPLADAISTYDRERSIMLIQKFAEKDERFINTTFPLTGRYVTHEQGFYDDKSDDVIKTDLQFLILIIYFRYAFEYGKEKLVNIAMKKIFGNTEENINA